MVFKTAEMRNLCVPNFNLSGACLSTSEGLKYLGHFILPSLEDDKDIARQTRKVFAQGNVILRRFHMCSAEVKLNLFRSFCSPMYTSQLWWSYKKSTIKKLHVSYHTILKLFLGFSKYESTSFVCTVFNVQCCQSIIRNLIHKFIVRLDKSCNEIIACLCKSSLMLTSRIRKHWCSLLHLS